MAIRSTCLRLALTAAGSASLLFALAGVSEAGTLVLNYEPNFYSDGIDGGGEFKVTNLTGFPSVVPAMGPGVQVTTSGVTGAFQTFCLEYSEHFTPGLTYNYTVGTSAVGGGQVWVGGVIGSTRTASGGSDALDARTAYLYTQFWNGTLSWVNGVTKNYEYSPIGANRAASALALQRAIWFIEGERSLAEIGNTGSDAYALYLQANAAVTSGSWGNTIGAVRIMNLTDANGNAAQSQLTMIMVPLPPAAWLGLAMMTGMGYMSWVRRRKLAL